MAMHSTTHDLAPIVPQLDSLREQIDALAEQAKAQRAEGVPPPAGRRQRRKGRDTMTTTQPAPAKPGSNIPPFTELLKRAEELGTQQANGADWQAKWDMQVLDFAYTGALDLTKNKHGDGIDDAIKLAEAYAKGRNSAVIFDHREGKQRKLASTTRKLIRLGTDTRYGVNEPMQTINSLMSMRQNFRKTANKGTRLEDAHNMLMRFARAQLKLDTIISDPDELKAFCFRKEGEPRTVAEFWHGLAKQIGKLRKGELGSVEDADDSKYSKIVLDAANARLTEIAKGKQSHQQAA